MNEHRSEWINFEEEEKKSQERIRASLDIKVKYKAGHSYGFTYEKQELYCPNCGKQSVWMETGGGDFYEGPNHVCVDCNSAFTLPRLRDASNEDKQVIKQIKENNP